MKFTEFNISERILKGLKDCGFINATEIQTKTIPLLMKGNSIIGQAKTGSGKTLAFGIPIIEQINENNNLIQACIISPTRELAKQIAVELSNICRHTNIRIMTIYGGVSIQRQIDQLKRGVHIVVATPGRLLDHLHHGLRAKPKILVLDEADKMFDMGFYDDVNQILKMMRWRQGQQQYMFFGATIPENTIKLARTYAPKAINVVIRKKDEERIPSTIEHFYYIVENSSDKLNYLTTILDNLINDNKNNNPNLKILIFVKTRSETRKLTMELKSQGYDVNYISSDLNQSQRERTLEYFRNRGRFLIATDVVSRGIDIENITHVINFDMPSEIKTYVHRIGRTGRMGKSGIAISFVFYEHEYIMSQIEELYKIRIRKKVLGRRPNIYY
ncbi:MAG: DEAD/DEAH box helicase [Candidatus Helarchaeota archaeon]